VNATDESAGLMQAFRDGDDSAFDALFERWAGPLMRYLERMVSDAGTAEELVQEHDDRNIVVVHSRPHGSRICWQHKAHWHCRSR